MIEFINLVSKKVVPVFLVAFIAILLVLFFGRDYHQRLSGGYELWKFPNEPGVSLNYKDGNSHLDVLEGPIFAYVDHADYIVVIQQDTGDTITEQNVTEIGSYFIIPLKNKLSNDSEKNITVSMDKATYQQRLQEMGLEQPAEFQFIDIND